MFSNLRSDQNVPENREFQCTYELRHDETNKMRPAKTQISLGIRPV